MIFIEWPDPASLRGQCFRSGKWRVEYSPKPIPDRRHDWDWWHEDFDGAPDSGDKRCGTAASVADAIEQIEELENERNS